jgi:hypothetical protein
VNPLPWTRLRIGLLSSLLGAGLASLAGAATVAATSEPELVDRATLVVHATVLSTQTAFRSGPGIRLVTEVSLEVHEVLKGEYPDPVLTLAMPGGARGSEVVHVPGTPRFLPGEQVCVFLAPLPGGLWTTLGISQGKFRLVPDPGTGSLVAEQARGARVVPRAGAGRAAHGLRPAPAGGAWGSFRRRIRERARGAR